MKRYVFVPKYSPGAKPARELYVLSEVIVMSAFARWEREWRRRAASGLLLRWAARNVRRDPKFFQFRSRSGPPSSRRGQILPFFPTWRGLLRRLTRLQGLF